LFFHQIFMLQAYNTLGFLNLCIGGTDMAERLGVFTRTLGGRAREATERVLASPQENVIYLYIKRVFDILFVLVALVLLAPLLLLIAIAIRLDSPGPIVLIQQRVGKGGKLFGFYKFRSMFQHTDPSVHREFSRQYINGHCDSSAGFYKPHQDQCVTRVGRFLRRTSLDELPQLFNILKGEMSLVGPRPSIAYELEAYAPRHFHRLEATPGLTGWAQIHGRSALRFDDIVTLDIEYIKRRSLKMDFCILLRTAPVVWSGKGAR
jgi:lipopolysaccharide/colanic/teichoic acid biosynthesis glycosyltransferase